MLRISVTLISAAVWAAAAAADSADDVVNGIAVPIVGGTVKLDLRARYEHADADGFEPSNAATLRTRLGYGTQPWEGTLRLRRDGEHLGGRPRLLLRRHPAQLARPHRDRRSRPTPS